MPIRCRLIENVAEDGVLLRRLPEWVSAIAVFFFGVQLLRPGSAFAVSPIYSLLDRMAPERTWGAVSLLIGLTQLVALLLNGLYPYIRRVTPIARALALLLGGSVWLATTVGFVRYNTTLPGIVAHATLAILNFTYAAIVSHEAAATLRRGLIEHASARGD